jgi:hypothetical protein
MKKNQLVILKNDLCQIKNITIYLNLIETLNLRFDKF